MTQHLGEEVGSAVRVSLADARADHLEPVEVWLKVLRIAGGGDELCGSVSTMDMVPADIQVPIGHQTVKQDGQEGSECGNWCLCEVVK